MNEPLIQVLVWSGVNFVVGATAMYAVYLVQERNLAAGYLLAGFLAVTITYIEMMVNTGWSAFFMAVAGLAGVAFVAWGWEPVFEDRNPGSSLETTAEQ